MATSMTNNGIVWNAAQAATGEVNTMDDYQEGTWTPIFNFQNGTQEDNKAFTAQVGVYTKFGRTIIIDSRVAGTYSGGNQDNVSQSIPFAARTTSACLGGGWSISGTVEAHSGIFSTYANGQAYGSFASGGGVGNFTNFMATAYTVQGTMPYQV